LLFGIIEWIKYELHTYKFKIWGFKVEFKREKKRESRNIKEK
jgi:hypothetical protein